MTPQEEAKKRARLLLAWACEKKPINLLKMIRQIEKANRAYRDALWEIRFCNEISPTLTYQAMESIALKALTENETERYTVNLTKNKK